MNEIEKMYENAKIKPYIYCSKPRLDCDAREKGSCKQDCKYYSGKKLLTQFTAEKQIKLLEFNYKYSRVPDIGYIIELNKYDCPHYEEYGAFDTFQEALCADINYHWEYFTEEEKEQIRNILERG